MFFKARDITLQECLSAYPDLTDSSSLSQSRDIKYNYLEVQEKIT